MTKDQEKIEQLVQQYLDMLNKKGEEILKLRGKNSAYNTIWSNYLTSIFNCMDKAKSRMEEIREGAVWDNLVIAFFGETNAGKSTIIETLRILFDEEERAQQLKSHPNGVDGLIVGIGSSDCTQVYKEYKMYISGQPFTLIDVPGIEGNEAKYIEEIKNALNKAHYVFYVQGQNKKPDTGTAVKIKAYLREWVKVYSIYNVRGVASNYDEDEERETLLTESGRKIETQINETFKELLGSTYMGNISLQAYLALCAKAKFASSRDDLLKGQKKIVSYFGDRESVYQFSQFQSLVEEVSQKSVDFKREIVEANKEKHKALLQSIQTELECESEKQREMILTLEKHIKEFQDNVSKDYNYAKENIKKKADAIYDQFFNQLTEKAVYAIKNNVGDKKKYCEKQVEEISKNQKVLFQKSIKKEIDDLNDNIKKHKKHLDQEIAGTTVYGTGKFSFSVDFEVAIGKLDANWGDIIGLLGELALGIWGAFVAANLWNPLGWILGILAVVGTFFTAIFGASDKESKAIKEMQDTILKVKRDNKPKFSSSITEINNKLTNSCNELLRAVNVDLTSLEELRNSIQSIMDYIAIEKSKLKIMNYGEI